MCSLIVRAELAFLRGVLFLLDDDFFALLEDLLVLDPDLELFFLLDVVELLSEFFVVLEEVWPATPLPCSTRRTPKRVAVNRLTSIVALSVTRFCQCFRALPVADSGTLGYESDSAV